MTIYRGRAGGRGRGPGGAKPRVRVRHCNFFTDGIERRTPLQMMDRRRRDESPKEGNAGGGWNPLIERESGIPQRMERRRRDGSPQGMGNGKYPPRGERKRERGRERREREGKER